MVKKMILREKLYVRVEYYGSNVIKCIVFTDGSASCLEVDKIDKSLRTKIACAKEGDFVYFENGNVCDVGFAK